MTSLQIMWKTGSRKTWNLRRLQFTKSRNSESPGVRKYEIPDEPASGKTYSPYENPGISEKHMTENRHGAVRQKTAASSERRTKHEPADVCGIK